MNIYQQKKPTDYHIQVTLAKYASENTLIKLMHGNHEREIYRIHGATSLIKIGIAIPKLSAFWASEYNVDSVDVVVEDTLLGAALVECLTERLAPEWHPRLPSSDGYYFVTDGKNVNIAQCGLKEPIFSFHFKGELCDVVNIMPCIDIDRNPVDTCAITHHTSVPYPFRWTEKAPDEDGWYFFQIHGVVKLGYSCTVPYNGEWIKERRIIKTFDGNVYYLIQCSRYAKVYIPNPP